MKIIKQFSISSIIAVLLCCTSATHAVHDVILFDTEDDWIEGDFDLHDESTLRYMANESGPFAARQQLSFSKSGEGFESDSLADYENIQATETAYSLTAIYKASPTWEIYAGIDLAAEFYDDGSNDESLEVNSLYVLKTLGTERNYIGIGRQEVADDRGWILDEHIDGVSYIKEADEFALTGFIGSHNQALEKLIGHEEDTDDHHSNLHNYIAYLRAYRAIDEDKQISGYLAYFSDEGFDQGGQNLYLGFRSIGDLSDSMYYWVEAAVLSGNTELRDIRAYALDTGFSYSWDELSFSPTYTMGLAYGSGDDGISTDGEFRQSGIHSNGTVFGGVTGLQYYGEVLNPQLSNLRILTTGLGIRPNDRFSIDLLLNNYWQINPSTSIKTDGIEFSPNGTDHFVGRGLDLVVGLRTWSHLSISFTYGRFHGNNNIKADTGSLEFLWNLY